MYLRNSCFRELFRENGREPWRISHEATLSDRDCYVNPQNKSECWVFFRSHHLPHFLIPIGGSSVILPCPFLRGFPRCSPFVLHIQYGYIVSASSTETTYIQLLIPRLSKLKEVVRIYPLKLTIIPPLTSPLNEFCEWRTERNSANSRTWRHDAHKNTYISPTCSLFLPFLFQSPLFSLSLFSCLSFARKFVTKNCLSP